jgi:type IV secretion system protein VirB8
MDVKAKRKSRATTQQTYFNEARSWDDDRIIRLMRSRQRDRWIAIIAVGIAVLAMIALASLVPFVRVVPFIIRVGKNTGYTDVVSTLNQTAGQVQAGSQEALDKYWLNKYIHLREGYLWATRARDRRVIGLMSSANVQRTYAKRTDPGQNPTAPVTLYGRNGKVRVNVNAISFINEDTSNGVKRVTALVQYTKHIKLSGQHSPLTHWQATVTYLYRNSPMQLSERRLNPLGFQVVSYSTSRTTLGS